MKKFLLEGGVYRDATFREVITPESYGPFDTYQEAETMWRGLMWSKVDNALHRLQIKEIDSE